MQRQVQLPELAVVAQTSTGRESPTHLAKRVEREPRQDVSAPGRDTDPADADAHIASERHMHGYADQTMVRGADGLEARLRLQPLRGG